MTGDRRSASVENHAAVDVEGLAGDVARAGGGQEDREGGDILGVVGPAERNAGVAPALHLLDRQTLLASPVLEVVAGQRRHRRARADRVDVDVVAGEPPRGPTGSSENSGPSSRGRCLTGGPA